MITADLGTDSPASAPEATPAPPPISAETTTEIDGIPGEEDEAPVIEAPAEEEAAPEAEAPPEPADDEKPQIENLTESRWKTVHKGYKYTREFAKAIGIVSDDKQPIDYSLLPPIEEIQGYQTAYSDRLAMEHDFASADPANAQQFIENWHGFSAEGMAAVAAKLPEYLSEVVGTNQQGQPVFRDSRAYMALAVPVLNRSLNHMLQSAPQIQDEGMRKYVMDLRRGMQWWLAGGPNAPDGSYDSDEQIEQALQQRPQQAAPNATEQRLQQAEARLNQIKQETATAQWSKTVASTNEEVGKEYWGAVNKALAPLKQFYPNETTFNALKNDYVGQVQKAMAADSFNARRYQIAEEQARRGQNGGVEAMKSAWLAWQRKAQAQIAPRFVSEASKNLVQANSGKHAALAKGAAKVGPASGGAPRPQSIVPDLKRAPGESASEFQMRRIAADMSA